MNIICTIAALLLAPLFPGIVNQTKAFFAGRRGPGFLRLYFDIAKLLRKSSPRSSTSTWIFDVAPSVAFASTVLAAAVFPWTLDVPALACAGSFVPVLFFYLLATGRFFTVLGALDTGSAFEGMGASREVQFSALAEPAVFAILGFLVLMSGDVSFPGILSGNHSAAWARHSVSLILAGLAFFAILLSETCRVPFDDPETHLELTMIHEAMILDNSGPDLAFIHYGAALKFEILAAFLAGMLLPDLPLPGAAKFAILLCCVAATAVATGVVESVMARMRFLKTPQMLFAATMLAMLGALLFILF